MDQVIAAAVLGLSFGNLWLCVLLVTSLATTNRATCGGYLIGRAGAILVFALAVSAIGAYISVKVATLHLVSGVLLAGFAAHLAATRFFGWVPPWKKAKEEGPACDGECSGCAARHDPEAHAICQDCVDDKLCDAEEPEVQALTTLARAGRGRAVEDGDGNGFLFGAGLGAVRGVATCAKMAVLIPILLDTSFTQALLVALAFTVTSSLYPLLGFLFGSWAMKAVRFKKALVVSGSVVLALTGVYYIVHGLTKMA